MSETRLHKTPALCTLPVSDGFNEEEETVLARPQRNRRICGIPTVHRFNPEPAPNLTGESSGSADSPEPVILTIDEYEALRLVDHEGLTHSECARQMNISRTTATEICESARKKVAGAIVCGRPLVIEGGKWELCSGNRGDCFLNPCTRAEQCGDSGSIPARSCTSPSEGHVL